MQTILKRYSFDIESDSERIPRSSAAGFFITGRDSVDLKKLMCIRRILVGFDPALLCAKKMLNVL